ASNAVADSAWVGDAIVTVKLAGLIWTDAIACHTASVAVPFTPSTVAVMVVVPLPAAVARPPLLTVATPGALLLHEMVRQEMAWPVESTACAVNCRVAPSATRLSCPGVTPPETVTCCTVSAADPVLPSTDALMFAVPLPTAVATPDDASTVA